MTQRDEDDRIGRMMEILESVDRDIRAALDAESDPLFVEVLKERQRQEVKFPGQVLPLCDDDNDRHLGAHLFLLEKEETLARQACEEANAAGQLVWVDVLDEEVCELHTAMQRYHNNPTEAHLAALRCEAVQVIAVIHRMLAGLAGSEDNTND